jgi:hypothetical protein
MRLLCRKECTRSSELLAAYIICDFATGGLAMPTKYCLAEQHLARQFSVFPRHTQMSYSNDWNHLSYPAA